MNKDKSFKLLQELGQRQVEENGDADACFFLFNKQNEECAIVSAKDLMAEENKDVCKAALKALIEHGGIELYYHVTSAWMLKMKPGDKPPENSPSQHPDRMSVLIVVEMHKTDGTRMWMREYEGEAGSIKWLEKNEADEKTSSVMASRFNIWHETQININEDER